MSALVPRGSAGVAPAPAEVVFESAPRAGLESGDIIALLAGHDDEIGSARPYAVFQEDAEEGHGPLYRFVVDSESGRNANIVGLQKQWPHAHLEVVRRDDFWGFRAPMAEDRMLQATRRGGAQRLRFASEHMGTWEEWIMDARSEALADEPWMTRRIVLRHRRLDRFELRVTAVRIGSSRATTSPPGRAPATPTGRKRAALVDRTTRRHGADIDDGDDDDDDEFFSPSGVGVPPDANAQLSGREYSSRPPPRAARRATRYRNDMYQMETPGRSEGGARSAGAGGDAVKEHTSVLHAMSGVMAKEFTVALRREIQARAAVESEVTDLHRASGELREWALKELDRLRTYAQTQVNELIAECAKRRDEANAYKSRMEEHAESSKMLDRALTRAFARRRKRSLQTRGFDALKTHAAQLARRRRLFTRVGSRIAKRAMARAFDAWSAKTTEAASLRARMARFATRWRNASAAAAFRTWRIAWRERAMRSYAARTMTSKARLRCVGPALRRWAATTRRVRGASRNFRRFTESKARRDASAVLREWFDASQDARGRRRRSARRGAAGVEARAGSSSRRLLRVVRFRRKQQTGPEARLPIRRAGGTEDLRRRLRSLA